MMKAWIWANDDLGDDDDEGVTVEIDFVSQGVLKPRLFLAMVGSLKIVAETDGD